MSKTIPIIDQIRIDKPCTADWNSMIGNDQVRFCEHCAKHVNDVSTMTVAQAERLVIKSHGNLCIRYQTSQDGSIKTVVKPKPFVELTRKISKVAAGAFAVALTVSNSAIAKPANAKATVTSVRENEKTSPDDEIQEAKTKMVAGTVTGPKSKSVSGANISVRGKTTGYEYSTTSGAFGVFVIDDLPIEVYSVEVTAPGFRTLRIDSLTGTDPVAKLELSMQEGDPNEVAEAPQEIRISGGTSGIMISRFVAIPGVNYGALQKFEDGKIPARKLNELTKMLALQNAIYGNKVDAVKSLLSAGVRLDGYERYDQESVQKYPAITAALFSISYETSAEIVDNLIWAGADPNLKDDYGRTPILEAAEISNAAAVQELIKFGSDVNDVDQGGWTPLMHSAVRDNTDAVRALIESGADVNHRDKEGRTALINVLSSYWQNSDQTREIIRLLKQQGATEFIEEPNVKTDPNN